MSELRDDLEALHTSMSKGWMQLGRRLDLASRKYGESPENEWCIVQHMHHILKGQFGKDRGTVRVNAMIHALGFQRGGDMYWWNDHPDTSWDDALDRVKQAIGEN